MEKEEYCQGWVFVWKLLLKQPVRVVLPNAPDIELSQLNRLAEYRSFRLFVP